MTPLEGNTKAAGSELRAGSQKTRLKPLAAVRKEGRGRAASGAGSRIRIERDEKVPGGETGENNQRRGQTNRRVAVREQRAVGKLGDETVMRWVPGILMDEIMQRRSECREVEKQPEAEQGSGNDAQADSSDGG